MKYLQTLVAMSLVAAAPLAVAQAAASAPSSPAKKALVAKVLKLQQASIENLARQIAEQPAMQLMQRAEMALQRMPSERREQLARDIQADARKYAEEAVPVVRERATALAPQTFGPVLEANFSEAELRQIVTILEYQQHGAETQRSLVEKLVAETRGTVEPKLKQLEQSVNKRLESVLSPSGDAGSGAKR